MERLGKEEEVRGVKTRCEDKFLLLRTSEMLSLAALGVAPPSRALGAADQDRAIAELMLEHDPALHLARNVLPARVSQDAGALYSWCRRLDQIVDSGRPRDQVSRELDSFEAAFDALVAGDPRDPADAALLSTLQRHPSLGRQPFDDMLAGMRADTAVDRRIATYDELREYGYQVAGTVGLMLLPLLGVESKAEVAAAREPAVALGVAIQIANILRDARPDAALGRVYLPQDELAAVGATDADIFAGRPTAAHREVVAKNAARARALLDDAEAGALAALPSWWASLMALVIVEQYRALLDVLADRDHDNLTGERCRVGKVGKMRAGLVAFGTLLKARARGVWFA